MRKIFILFFCFSLFFTSCANNNMSEIPDESNLNNEEGGFQFEFIQNLNILEKSTNDSYIPLSDNTMDYSENGIDIAIKTSAIPDASLNWSEIDLEVFVFVDGAIIPHTSTYSKEPIEISKFTVDTNKIYEIPIFIPKIDNIKSDLTLLTVVCNYAPSHIPEDGKHEFSGIIDYSIFLNTASFVNNKESHHLTAVEEDYINEEFKEAAVDVGYKFKYKAGYELSGNHMFEDVILSKEEKNLHLKASLGEQINKDYYAGIFCNGELLDAFDGSKFIKFNTLNGTRILDFIINEEVLPTEGTYTFQAVLIPSSDAIGTDEIESFSTDKHRVIIT